MRSAPVVLCSVVASIWPAIWPAIAFAAPASHPVEVIGGSDAAAGAWPDVAAILFQLEDPPGSGIFVDEALCTGTLIAPTVVITAGHCYAADDPPLPDNVLIGTASLARPQDGETLHVRTGIVYPNAETSEDVAVLILDQASKATPRTLATGWPSTDIVDGAKIELVGFGAIDQTGKKFVDELQQASTTITDADCSSSSGCNADARPAGELGAGGDGIDTCPGDSGGPLYLTTSYGTYLAGVTSRSYDNAKVSCSGGGIYERPDKFADWIEQVTGVSVLRGPSPSADPLTAAPGASGDTMIVDNDPGSDDHHYEVTTQPAHGRAAVRGDGLLRVCPDAKAAAGADQVTVRVIDSKNSHRALLLTVPITVAADPAAMPGCDFSGFGDSGGCCDAGGRSGGSIPLALGVLALVARRRRR